MKISNFTQQVKRPSLRSVQINDKNPTTEAQRLERLERLETEGSRIQRLELERRSEIRSTDQSSSPVERAAPQPLPLPERFPVENATETFRGEVRGRDVQQVNAGQAISSLPQQVVPFTTLNAAILDLMLTAPGFKASKLTSLNLEDCRFLENVDALADCTNLRDL